jgi:hypothetical protein
MIAGQDNVLSIFQFADDLFDGHDSIFVLQDGGKVHLQRFQALEQCPGIAAGLEEKEQRGLGPDLAMRS